jgi:O-antigen/teichoic acid export membrane protein
MTRNFAYSAISAGSAALMVLLLSLAAWLLGEDEFGAFFYAINVATIAEVLMDFGLHQVTIRAVAQRPAQAAPLLAKSLVLKIVPGLAMVAIGTAAVWILREEAHVRLASFVMLLSAAMRSYLLTARGILQGLERFNDDAVVTVGDRLLLVVSCSVALLAGAGVVGVSVVFFVTRAVSAVLALTLARVRAGTQAGEVHEATDLIREALPVGLFLLVLNLYNRVDTLMLGSMLGDQPTGIYGAAYTLYEGLTYATAIVSAVLTPRLSSLWPRDRAAYRQLVRQGFLGTIGLSIAIGVVTWFLAQFGIGKLFPAFPEAVRTLRLLLLGLPFIYVIWVLHAVALSAHLTQTLVRVTAMGIAVNVGLNLWLIPRYAENGAAMATAISEGIVMTLLFYYLRGAIWRRANEGPA